MRIQKGIIGIAICILIFLFLLFLPWLNIMEGDTFIESPVDAVVREEGEICIVDKGGSRILFLNKEQKIESRNRSANSIIRFTKCSKI